VIEYVVISDSYGNLQALRRSDQISDSMGVAPEKYTGPTAKIILRGASKLANWDAVLGGF